ncbi:uncharacterized protein C1orf131 homolog [Megalops cyprinoides]|uniref:uncharacterized protein C1orf131 homolog n=1 Tax=Megalops cyprinoides TaxID=118141 RepID=UPI001863DEB9|nr:uncharacterized protein C1orf131 homolog [Megalops cyprinoides]
MSRKIDEDGGDTDHKFLDDVLNKLYDFGDGARQGRKKKSLKPKKRKCSEEEKELTSVCNGNEDSVDECHELTEQRIVVTAVSESSKDGNTRLATKRPAQVEIVTFQDPSKKKKVTKTLAPEVKPPPTEEKKEDSKEFSLEKARLEVHRFGITGYQKEQQRMFEQERAIMLGAKPPKKEYVNYKVYQQMIKEKKLKAKEEVKLDNKKTKKRESKPRDEKKKASSSVIPTGQVGRFKNGMLVLSSKEIQRIKSSKVIK